MEWYCAYCKSVVNGVVQRELSPGWWPQTHVALNAEIHQVGQRPR